MSQHPTSGRRPLDERDLALISIRIRPYARRSLREFQGFLESLAETRHVYFVSRGLTGT